MPLELRLRIVDVKTGKVEVDQPSHSWVRQFAEILCQYFGSGVLAVSQVFGWGITYPDGIIDTANVSHTAAIQGATGYNIVTCAPAANSNYGIEVGTDDTVEDIDDYKLAVQITHGVGAGQLKYGSGTLVEATNNAGTVSIVLNRMFSNGSGNTITIKEVGMVATMATSTGFYYLLIRDVLGAAVDTLNGESKLVQYILQSVN